MHKGPVTAIATEYGTRLDNQPVSRSVTVDGVPDFLNQYAYDCLNRWIARSHDPDGDGPLDFADTYFVYDGTPPSGSLLDRAAVTMENIGQIVLHFEADTDTTTIVNHLTYDAYGRITSQSDPDQTTLFAFTARPFDPATDLQNNLNHWYDPVVGRWLSEDPIGVGAGAPNLYRYVENVPTVYVDPEGEAWWNLWISDVGYWAGDRIETWWSRPNPYEKIVNPDVGCNANATNTRISGATRVPGLDRMPHEFKGELRASGSEVEFAKWKGLARKQAEALARQWIQQGANQVTIYEVLAGNRWRDFRNWQMPATQRPEVITP